MQTTTPHFNAGYLPFRQHGLGLVEALIALLILATSLLGAAMRTTQSLADIHAGQLQLRVAHLAADLTATASDAAISPEHFTARLIGWTDQVHQVLPGSTVRITQLPLSIDGTPAGVDMTSMGVSLSWVHRGSATSRSLRTTLPIPFTN